MNATFVDLAGLALLHSLWQGLVIAGALGLALHLLRGVSPGVRYLVCWVALVAMVAAPVGLVLGGQGGLAGQGVGGWEEGAVAPATTEGLGGGVDEELAALQESSFAVRPFLVVGWLVGVVVMLARLVLGWRAVHRLCRLPGEALGEDLRLAVDRLRNRLGIDRLIRITVTDRAGEPMLIGWLKPVVLIPAALLAGMPVAQVEAILAHELAHIRRHDYLFAVLQSLMEAVLFYHPAAWWISGKIREERERACDDLAVAAINNRVTYARALAGLEQRRVESTRLALLAGGGSLLERIQRLVEPPAPDRLRSSAGVVLVVAMVVISGFLMAACNEKTLPGEPLVEDLAALPDELATMIQQADIEGTITYLHDRREAGDPGAYQLLLDAFRAAKDDELRRNMVFVFAHFNTLEADRELIRIAETDSEPRVRQNTVRAINMRIPRDQAATYGVAFTRGEPIGYNEHYPKMSDEQIEAVRPGLRRIALDSDNPSNSSAVHALAWHGDEKELLEELLMGSENYLLLSDAVVLLGTPDDQGRSLRDLYHRWNGEGLGRHHVLGRLVSSFPSMEGVELVLDAARDDMKQHFEGEYAILMGYLERFPPELRLNAITRLEQEQGTFEAGSQPADELRDMIKRLNTL
ncbi:MAG: M56 family metallopeptidase [Rhodothermales bacterium]|nr:M56 family metallopeptidase [Rhodothermales bacterium]